MRTQHKKVTYESWTYIANWPYDNSFCWFTKWKATNKTIEKIIFINKQLPFVKIHVYDDYRYIYLVNVCSIKYFFLTASAFMCVIRRCATVTIISNLILETNGYSGQRYILIFLLSKYTLNVLFLFIKSYFSHLSY